MTRFEFCCFFSPSVSIHLSPSLPVSLTVCLIPRPSSITLPTASNPSSPINMGYRDFFTRNVKWSKVPIKDLHAAGLHSDDVDEADLDSDTSTLLGEKTKPTQPSGLRRGLGRFLWLLHVALLGANITWWLTWNSWMHPADVFSTSRTSCESHEWVLTVDVFLFVSNSSDPEIQHQV